MQTPGNAPLKPLKRVRLFRGVAAFLSAVLPAVLVGCSGVSGGKVEYAWVASPEAALRDRVAAVYNKTGSVHNGERVQVLERLQSKRFVKIRSPRNEEGWVQERYLASQQTYEQLEQLAAKYKDIPAQSVGVTRAGVNLHVTPGRKTEHIYQLSENERVDLLVRQIADRNAAPPPPPVSSKPAAKKGEKGKAKETETKKENDRESGSDLPLEDQAEKPSATPIMEDWWLVRSSQKKVGWVLGRILFFEVPIEIGQYAGGQRIVAFFVLDEVQDKDKKVPEYMALMSENKDGLTDDFSQVRVFSWSLRKHRYETAYHERLAGMLPATVGRENNVPIFTLRTRNNQTGAIEERKYTFNTPMVHRAYAEGEEPAKGRRRR